MDLTIVLTGLGVVAAVVGSNIALIGWLRSDMKSFETEITKEMKDFHGRLCSIEERNKK